MSKLDPVSRYSRALDAKPVPSKSSAAVAAALPQLAKNPRPRDFSPSPVGLMSASDGTHADEIRPQFRVATSDDPPIGDPCIEGSHAWFLPAGWIKGQLLNVRNNGSEYVITILGEEFDPRYPERALRFSNPALCQDFISHWYQRENSDPRAR